MAEFPLPPKTPPRPIQAESPTVNGDGKKPVGAKVEAYLEQPMAGSYKPSMPTASLWMNDEVPPYWRMLRDIEAMRRHPRVNISMLYYRAAIWPAEFDVLAESSQVGEWVEKELKRFWTRHLFDVQLAYEYGYNAFEPIYENVDGLWQLKELHSFSPLDTNVLMHQNEIVGVRVRGIDDPETKKGSVDLPAAEDDVPAKGLWYSHASRYGSPYGWTQLYGGHWPWRRLAGRDGLEDVLEAAFYRQGYQGPQGWYPPGDSLATRSPQGSGNRRPNRDVMLEMLENAKAGMNVAFPSTTDEHGNRLWDAKWNDNTLRADGMLAWQEVLEKQIALGIGVPPEIMQASDVGSGYSGREIPKEAFFISQQVNGEEILALWVKNIGLPLAKMNFGPRTRFEVIMQPLLKSQQQQAMGMEQGIAGGPGMPGQQQPGAGMSPNNPLAALFGGGGASASGMKQMGLRVLQAAAHELPTMKREELLQLRKSLVQRLGPWGTVLARAYRLEAAA